MKLFVDTYCSQTCFALDNAVGNFHLPAQSWKPDNKFNWVDVVSNHNKLSLVLKKPQVTVSKKTYENEYRYLFI